MRHGHPAAPPDRGRSNRPEVRGGEVREDVTRGRGGGGGATGVGGGGTSCRPSSCLLTCGLPMRYVAFRAAGPAIGPRCAHGGPWGVLFFGFLKDCQVPHPFHFSPAG